jgi:hypothetical protein
MTDCNEDRRQEQNHRYDAELDYHVQAPSLPVRVVGTVRSLDPWVLDRTGLDEQDICF